MLWLVLWLILWLVLKLILRLVLKLMLWLVLWLIKRDHLKKNIWWHFLETGRIPKRLFVVASTNVKKCFISGFKPALNYSLWQVLITISRTQKSRMTFQWLKTYNELKKRRQRHCVKILPRDVAAAGLWSASCFCWPEIFSALNFDPKKWTISEVKKNSGLCSSCANPTPTAWSPYLSSSFC